MICETNWTNFGEKNKRPLSNKPDQWDQLWSQKINDQWSAIRETRVHATMGGKATIKMRCQGKTQIFARQWCTFNRERIMLCKLDTAPFPDIESTIDEFDERVLIQYF